MERNHWLDNLRSSVTVLVVAHHAAMAYATFGFFDKTAYIRSTSPIVDDTLWIGMDIFISFNDIFFMPLMFLISGLFAVKSIRSKGKAKFFTDRLKRLGVPFATAVMLIIPIAYIPSYYLAKGSFSIVPFIRDYIFTEQWPVGPPWFIWILLAFNAIAVMLPVKVYDAGGRFVSTLTKDPLLFFGVALLITAISYIPVSLFTGHYAWIGFGPFDFQVNRVVLYFAFFILGTFLGNTNWENSKLLAIRWPFWAAMSLCIFAVIEAMTYFGGHIAATFAFSEIEGVIIFDALFAASCIISSLAFITFFKQKITSTNPGWTSLSANAFGIYLIHYLFVTWLQFALLKIELPTVLKFTFVFAGALLLSWFVIASIRKINAVCGLL